MKNKKVINTIIIVFVIIMGILGYISFGEKNNQNVENTDNVVEEVKGNYNVIEAMKHIEVTNTVEEINNIIGFEGEKSEFSEDCTWKLDSKNWITLKNAGNSSILQATINKETIKNENITLPSRSELQDILNNGSLTYEELVEKVGGVEGTLESKTATSVGYIWVDKNQQTLGATFNNESGKCTVASYR